MATNFPDTTPPALNPDTGLEWAAGDTFDDTAESGLVYVWSPPVWKTSVEAIPETDGRYVNVSGDNMTGPLTIGPEGGPAAATLANDGSATFASVNANIDFTTTNHNIRRSVAAGFTPDGGSNGSLSLDSYTFSPQLSFTCINVGTPNRFYWTAPAYHNFGSNSTNKNFVALSQQETNSYIAYSDNGIRWIQSGPSNTNGIRWQEVIWSDTANKYLGLGHVYTAGSPIVYSNTGTSWARSTTGITDGNWQKLVDNGTNIRAFERDGSNRTLVSTDGTSWSAGSPTLSGSLRDAIWSQDDSQYVVVYHSSSQNIATSSDGTTWTARALPSTNPRSIAYSPSLDVYVTVGIGSCYSTDGAVTWTASTSTFNNITTWTDVEWAEEYKCFVALAPSGGLPLAISLDGINWEVHFTSVAQNSPGASGFMKYVSDIGAFYVGNRSGAISPQESLRLFQPTQRAFGSAGGKITGGLSISNTAEIGKQLSVGSDDYPRHAIVGYSNLGSQSTILALQYNPAGIVFSGRNASVNGTDDTFRIYADGRADFAGTVRQNVTVARSLLIETETDNEANYSTTVEEYSDIESYTDSLGNIVEREVTKTRDVRTYTGPTLDVKERLQNLIARLDSLEADEVADDATSTLLLTTVNNLNEDMAKTKAALTAIRAAASVAGTLDQLKADIVTATADI